MIEIRASVPLPDDEEGKKYIDIFKKIERGLCTDYVDPLTNQIWHVQDYLNGLTNGVEVYTKYGRFLGTAYPISRVTLMGGTDGEIFLEAKALERKRTNDKDIFQRLEVAVRESIHGDMSYAHEKEEIIEYLYSPKFREASGMSTKEVDEKVMAVWNKLRRENHLLSYDELTDSIISQAVADLEQYEKNFMQIYRSNKVVRQYVFAVQRRYDAERELKDLRVRRKACGSDKVLDIMVEKAAGRVLDAKKEANKIRMRNLQPINRFLKITSELRTTLAFFNGGQARAMVDGDQSVIDAAVTKLENRNGFSAFLATIKNFKRKDWFN